MATKEEILDSIANMTVLELSELLKAFEEKFGVTAAAPVAAMPVGAVAGGDGQAAVQEEEQDEFDVVLGTPGPPPWSLRHRAWVSTQKKGLAERVCAVCPQAGAPNR